MSNGPSTSYDEQLGMTFTQSFTSMLYNSTAVEQSDSSSGVGPGYLLNGLSNTGYWYQVGLDYNWIYTSGGYDAGFHMGYEVFNPSGNSIFPIVCCGGLLSFSGPVNEGDVVALNLYFTSSGQVVFLAKDYNTGAYASETYSAEGATYFTGLDQTANSYGFFTGLMTEWYHPSAYYGGEQEVTYSSTFALSSAYMWMDEFESNGQTNGTLLFSAGSGLLSYSDPTQLQAFSSNGATEYSDAYEFLTGALSQIPLTVSYSVQGSDIGYSPPILTYVTGGETKTSTLGTSSSVFNCDPGSSWSVQPMLGGSNSSERWETVQGTSGTASVPQALAFVYYNQYYPSFQITAAAQTKFDSDMTLVITATQFGTPGTSVCQIITSSAATASCQAWVDEGGLVVFPQFLNNPPADTRWQNAAGALSASQVLSSSSVTADYYEQVLEAVSYSISDTTPGYSVPTLDYTSLGYQLTNYPMSTTPSPVWLDYGTTWMVTPNLLTGSTSTQRWEGASGTSGLASQGGTINPEYFHQFLTTLSYSVVGGGSPGAPVINETAFGITAEDTLTSSPLPTWVDSGSIVNLPSSLFPSSASERWATNSMLTIEVDSAVTESAVYQHQYYVEAESAMTGGGSVSPGSRWYDAASILSLIATPSPNWSLGTWVGTGSGSYSGTNASLAFEVEGPVNETAVFYPGINLTVEAGGSVTYSYGTTSGQAAPGQRVLYVPPGTNVTLVANPSSLLYSFGGWAASHSPSASTMVITVSAPTTTEAKFSYNLLTIGALVGAVLVIAAAIVIYRARTQGRRHRAQERKTFHTGTLEARSSGRNRSTSRVPSTRSQVSCAW